METPMLQGEAIGDLKDNIMETQHLDVEQNRKKWLEQGCKFDPKRNLWVGPNY